jgi:hypothetical protein
VQQCITKVKTHVGFRKFPAASRRSIPKSSEQEIGTQSRTVLSLGRYALLPENMNELFFLLIKYDNLKF